MISPAIDLQNTFRGRKVLITGGLGFIGSNLAHALTGMEACVTVVDALIPESGANRFNLEGLNSVRVHFEDVRTCDWARVLDGQEYLFNLAGLTSHLDSMAYPVKDREINADSQLALLEACRKHHRDLKIIHASTRQIYGKPSYLPVDEKHPTAPVDINGIHKLAGEYYHQLYHKAYGIRSCILRLTNTFGPRMRIRDSRQGFIGLWVRLALEGTPFEVWDGEQRRDMTYVGDVVDAFLRAAASGKTDGEIFNVGGAEVLSLKELASRIAGWVPGARYQLCDFPPDRKAIDIGDYSSDYSRIRAALGWQPVTSLQAGFAATFDYYRKFSAHYLPVKEKQPG